MGIAEQTNPNLRGSAIVQIAEEVYEEIISFVDAQDLGRSAVEGPSMSAIISSFNAEDIYSHEQDICFIEAVVFARGYLERVIAKKIRDAVKRYEVSTLAEKQEGPVLVIENGGLPWKRLLVEKQTLLHKFSFVVYETGNDWKLQAVPDPKDPSNRFGMKHKIPSDVANRVGCVFVHPAGFIAGFETKDQAINAGVEISSRF